MRLRSLVVTSGTFALATGLSAVLAFAATGHPNVARGLLFGLLVGLLNHLLLARKFGRVIDGRDPWQDLRRSMRWNMLLRFAMIVASGAVAAHTPGVNVTAMACGIVVYVVVTVAYAMWTVVGPWRKEGESSAYG